LILSIAVERAVHQISSFSNAAAAAAVFLFEGMIGLSEMFVLFVHIHADAYMFTLKQSAESSSEFRVPPLINAPINALSRISLSDTLSLEAALFKDVCVPRPECCRAKEYAATELEHFIERNDLLESGASGVCWVEPVH
jgi:hypothetical protein